MMSFGMHGAKSQLSKLVERALGKLEGLPIVTANSAIADYGVETIWI